MSFDRIPFRESIDALVGDQYYLLSRNLFISQMASTATKQVHVGAQELFERMITAQKGFGSYCFGLNTLLKGILQALKYRFAIF